MPKSKWWKTFPRLPPCRLMAVCFPLKYKLWSRPTVVVAVEVAVTVPAVVALMLAFVFVVNLENALTYFYS